MDTKNNVEKHEIFYACCNETINYIVCVCYLFAIVHLEYLPWKLKRNKKKAGREEANGEGRGWEANQWETERPNRKSV